jgi:hypothetical protein
MNALEEMKNLYASNYQGSITAKLEELQALEESQMPVANTSREKSIGLTGSPMGSSMVFNGGMAGKSMVATDRPVNITELASSGKVIATHEGLQPGGSVRMSNFTDSVVERDASSPQLMKTGGAVVPLSERIKKHKCLCGKK